MAPGSREVAGPRETPSALHPLPRTALLPVQLLPAEVLPSGELLFHGTLETQCTDRHAGSLARFGGTCTHFFFVIPEHFHHSQKTHVFIGSQPPISPPRSTPSPGQPLIHFLCLRICLFWTLGVRHGSWCSVTPLLCSSFSGPPRVAACVSAVCPVTPEWPPTSCGDHILMVDSGLFLPPSCWDSRCCERWCSWLCVDVCSLLPGS